MKRLILPIALLATVESVAAPVVGTVRDKRTGEALIGAVVRAKNVEQAYTTTGFDGSFVINGLPDSIAVTLEVNYMSYQPVELQIVPSQSDSVNVEMESRDVALGVASVVAHKLYNTDLSAQRLEMKSMNTVNVMSAQSIRLSPDLNVGSVLQRMSGVVMEKNGSGEGQYAILRGMDKRYNYSLVDGVKLPSPDDGDRYVPLNLFPGELLDRLEVSKSLTPDMEGDASGGVVNMVMKDAPSHFTFDVNAAAGYNSFFFDHDFASAGHGFTSDAPRERYGSDYKADPVNDFSRASTTISHAASLPDMVAGIAAGGRFFGQRLGVMAAGSFENRYRGNRSLFYSDDMKSGDTTTHVTELQNRYYSRQQMQYGAPLKLDYTPLAGQKITWYNSFIGSTERSVRESYGTDLSMNYAPARGMADRTFEMRSMLEKQAIFSSTLRGDHRLGDAFALDWSALYSYASNRTPDRTYVDLDNVIRPANGSRDSIMPNSMERRFEHNDDRNWGGALNVKYGHDFARLRLEVKAGGLYRTKRRENRWVKYLFEPAGTGRRPVLDGYYPLETIEWEFRNATYARGSVGQLDYDAGEDIGAAYLMGRIEHRGFEAVFGVRGEHTHQSYTLLYPVNGSPDPAHGSQRYWDILPSVNLKFKPTERMNVRADYFRSINRPGFYEIVPYNIMGDDYTELGNPNLRRARIDNADLRWEWYPTDHDQLMAGVFYKHIKDPIEQAYYTINNRQSGFRPDNLGTANNWGFELDATKYVRHFGVRANYTYTHSAITTSKSQNYTTADGAPAVRRVDQTRPLVGQAAHVANLSLLYKDTRYGWNAQLAGSYIGERLAMVSNYLDADYWDGGIFTLDLSVEKKFGQQWSVFFKGNNLLNATARRYVKTTNPRNEGLYKQTLAGKTLIRESRDGVSLLVGARFTL